MGGAAAGTVLAVLGTGFGSQGSALAQPLGGQALPTPEAVYTISSASITPIIVHTEPHAICSIDRAAGRPAKHPVHLYADDDGVVRIYAQPAPRARASEALRRVTVTCQTDGGVESHPLAFRVNATPTAEAPFPAAEAPPALHGVAVPALSDAQAQAMSDQELRGRHYPPRPDRERAPEAYAAWLRAVSTPSTFVVAYPVASPDIRNQSVATSPNWSGFLVQQPAGQVANVAGVYTVPAVTAGRNQVLHSSMWVGIDGVKPIADLVQTGTEQGATNIWGVSFSYYYPWTEYLPAQPTESVLSSFNVTPGDQMFANVWVDAAPAAAGNPSAFTYTIYLDLGLVTSLQQHVFYRDADGAVYQVYYDPFSGLSFEAWTGYGSPTDAPLAAGDPATMVANNQQHIFYRDGSGNIQHVLWDPNSGQRIEVWASGGGNSTTGPAASGDPATMVTSNEQHIFYRDWYNNIQHVFWDANSGRHVEQWAAENPHGEQGPAAWGDPKTMFANNQQHIFYRAAELIPGTNQIFHVFWDPNTGLHDEVWAGGGSPNNAPPAAGDPATMVTTNEQHIFYRDFSGNIWHVFWDSGSGMHLEQWAGGGGSSTMGPAAAGDPATMVTTNEQHIFYRDQKANIQHVFWDANSGRHVEQWAGGAGNSQTGPAAAGDPTTMVWNTEQHIFYRDSNGRLQHVFWDPNSGRHAEQWAGPGPNGMGNFGEFYLKNITQSWSTQVRLPIGYGGAQGQTAEWIMERPTVNGSYSGLADYGTTQITDAVAGSNSFGLGEYACCGTNSVQLNMTSDGTSSGRVLSQASAGGLETVDFTWKAPY
jgi:hypothetical protein